MATYWCKRSQMSDMSLEICLKCWFEGPSTLKTWSKPL